MGLNDFAVDMSDFDASDPNRCILDACVNTALHWLQEIMMEKKVSSLKKFLINEQAPKISMLCEIASNWATKTDFSILVVQLPVNLWLVTAYVTQH